MNRLVLASNNAGKLAEFSRLLFDLDVALVSQGSLKIQAAEENGLSFIENALIKARHAAQESGLPAIADDSGLTVDALGGAPGIYSSRFAGPNASDDDNNHKLLKNLVGCDERSARFCCALAYLRHAEDPFPILATGYWTGEILRSPRGTKGFGYDPIFFVPEIGLTAAEMLPTEKNSISHRARASEFLLSQLQACGY